MRREMPCADAARAWRRTSAPACGTATAISAAKSTARHSVRLDAGAPRQLRRRAGHVRTPRPAAGVLAAFLLIAPPPATPRGHIRGTPDLAQQFTQPLAFRRGQGFEQPPIHCVCSANSFRNGLALCAQQHPHPPPVNLIGLAPQKPSRSSPSSRPVTVARVTPARSANSCGDRPPDWPVQQDNNTNLPSDRPRGSTAPRNRGRSLRPWPAAGAQAHAVRRCASGAPTRSAKRGGFQHAVRTVHVPLLKNKKAAYHMAANYISRTEAGDSRQRQVCYPRRNRYPDRPRQPGSCPSSLSQPNVRRLPCAACAWTCPCCWPWSPTRVMRCTGVKPATEARRRELLDWLREAPGKLGHWAVVADGDAVGWASLTPLPGTDRIQLAYRLQRRAWGRGCATARPPAVRLCMAHAGCRGPVRRRLAGQPGLAARAKKTRLRPGRHQTHYGRDPWPICCRVRPHAITLTPFLEPSTHDRRPQHRPPTPASISRRAWKA